MSEAAELYDAILKGNAKKAEEVTKAALAANVDPSELVQKYMIPAMDEVGKRFECNDYFVPELLIAARAMKISLALITPYLTKSGVEPTARAVIGTVQGDLHDIGKNLVASMLEGGGFQVVDLGVNVPPQKFVEAAQEKEGTIVALGALLTTTMTMMKTVIDALSQAGIRSKTHVMVGGAPITQQYADEIGVDGYTDNAGSAVALARKLRFSRSASCGDQHMQMNANTIFITGGTSGIGKGLAEAFYKLGNQVIISGRREDRLRDICAANPGMRYFVLDVRDPAAIRTVARKVVAEFPSLNCVFNNAGVQRRLELAPGHAAG